MFTKEKINDLIQMDDITSIKSDKISAEVIATYLNGNSCIEFTIQTTKGIVIINFNESKFYNWINHLGVCKLNGKEIETESLIGEFSYSTKECNMRRILTKLMDI